MEKKANVKKEQVEQFLNDLTRWAVRQKDLLAVALVGSYARGTATINSDVDIVLISSHLDHYLKDNSWAASFGVVEKRRIEQYGLVTSLRIWYAGGLEVEYGISDERWAALPLDAGTRQVISDGMRILFERGDVLSRHLTTQ